MGGVDSKRVLSVWEVMGGVSIVLLLLWIVLVINFRYGASEVQKACAGHHGVQSVADRYPFDTPMVVCRDGSIQRAKT